jgi:hypothetical protein
MNSNYSATMNAVAIKANTTKLWIISASTSRGSTPGVCIEDSIPPHPDPGDKLGESKKAIKQQT